MSMCFMLLLLQCAYMCMYALYTYLPTPLPSPGAPRGEIVIIAEEVQDSKYNIAMQLSASHLDKKDFFGKVDTV